MISYNSNKYNNLIKEIVKILEINNINTDDSEQIISADVIALISQKVQLCVVSAEHFLTEKCPKCAKTHLKIFSSTYSRNIIFKINNLLIKIKISIPRLICENCNSTHAVLPDFCVPLKQYSREAIIEIASEAVITSTEKTANSLNIEPKQVRRFVNLVKSFLPNLSVLIHILKLQINILENLFKNLYKLLEQLPNVTQIYFKHFRAIFLLEKNNRHLYIEYAKLSN